MTLPDPYRGHAQPTWDTKTLAALITALGGVGAVPADRYAPSAKAYFCDVFMSNGAGDPIQVVPNATWRRVDLRQKTTDTTNSFNTTTHIYTVPVTGFYFCQALIRLKDDQVAKAAFPDGTGIGIGIGTSEVDFPGFQWNKWMWMSGAGGNRLSLDYTRLCAATLNDPMRLYVYSDLGGQFDIYSAAMQIWRIG